MCKKDMCAMMVYVQGGYVCTRKICVQGDVYRRMCVHKENMCEQGCVQEGYVCARRICVCKEDACV